jgi:hypothetical protein
MSWAAVVVEKIATARMAMENILFRQFTAFQYRRILPDSLLLFFPRITNMADTG